MNNFDPKKFVFHELFTNTNGKSSGSGFAGIITILAATAAFIAAMVGYFLQIPNTLEVMEIILKTMGISALLLGVRKAAGRFGNGNSDEKQNKNENSSSADDIILETPKKG